MLLIGDGEIKMFTFFTLLPGTGTHHALHLALCPVPVVPEQLRLQHQRLGPSIQHPL